MMDTLTRNAPAPRARRPRRKIDAAMRARIEAAIAAMIDTLDALDAPAEDQEEGDPGGEEGGSADDEPSLGWSDFEARYGAKASGDDREGDEHDGSEPDVDDELGGDEEPSLGAQEPLEPEPGAGSMWCGRWSKYTKAEREQVYDQRNCYGFASDDREADNDADQEHVRTDPAKLAKAQERFRGPSVAEPDGSDGRLVFVGGRGSNVRPLTAEERNRMGL